MRKKLILVLSIAVAAFQLEAQEKFMTKDGFVSFFSHTLVEDIKADNHQALSIINMETGEIAIQILMRSFQFKKALMQEHFNESYIESHKYPKAKFSGLIINLSEIENGSETEIEGTLSIHGKEKRITIISMVDKTNETIRLSGDFTVEVSDFDIKIPSIVRNNIAKTIKVTFDLEHKPYKR